MHKIFSNNVQQQEANISINELQHQLLYNNGGKIKTLSGQHSETLTSLKSSVKRTTQVTPAQTLNYPGTLGNKCSTLQTPLS